MTIPRHGRPRLDPDDRSTQLNVRLPSKHYDDVYQRAAAERLTMSEWIRRTMRAAIVKQK